MSKEIIAGNKLIAEFMGMKITSVNEIDVWVYTDIHNGIMEETNACFHHSWDWLMPVVEKIAKTKLTYLNVPEDYYPYPVIFGMLDEEGNFMVRLTCAPLFKSSTLIGATWLSVVDFIKSENNQP